MARRLAEDFGVAEAPQTHLGLSVGSRMTVTRQPTNDRASLAGAMHRVLAWDFNRVILGHGAVLETGDKPALARACSSFLGSPLP